MAANNSHPLLLTPATNNPTTYRSSVSPTLSIFILSFIGLFILLIFFFIYNRFCLGNRPIVTPAAATTLSPQNRGLDSALLHSFPTFLYSHDAKENNHSVDCAVCLCDFERRDTLRLIPLCRHVFHRDCIDAWLDSHVTCPVCRRNLKTNSATAVVVVDDRERDLVDLVRIGSERRGVRMGSVRKKLGRSVSLGGLPAGGEKDGRVWFWRSLRLSATARERGFLDGTQV